jgi:spore coat polysaccharide biosynthesis predicted glycosyltransferase SpsG
MLSIKADNIIFAPDCNPKSGLGHYLRTIILMGLLKSPSGKYLLSRYERSKTDDICAEHILCKSTEGLPNKLFNNSLALVVDSYDQSEIEAVYNDLRRRASKKISLYALVDTLEQVRLLMQIDPATTIVFPNILSSRMNGDLARLSQKMAIKIKQGYQYILLDKITLDTPRRVRPSTLMMDTDPATCLMSFGFSEIQFSNQMLDHIKECLEKIISTIPCIKFSLIGDTALRIAEYCSIEKQISQFHRFCSKKQLVLLYDESQLYFGSVGYSMWERAFRLLPSFVLAIANNQECYVDVGSELQISYSSTEMLEEGFDLHKSIQFMLEGTCKFHREILKR